MPEKLGILQWIPKFSGIYDEAQSLAGLETDIKTPLPSPNSPSKNTSQHTLSLLRSVLSASQFKLLSSQLFNHCRSSHSLFSSLQSFPFQQSPWPLIHCALFPFASSQRWWSKCSTTTTRVSLSGLATCTSLWTGAWRFGVVFLVHWLTTPFLLFPGFLTGQSNFPSSPLTPWRKVRAKVSTARFASLEMESSITAIAPPMSTNMETCLLEPTKRFPTADLLVDALHGMYFTTISWSQY